MRKSLRKKSSTGRKPLTDRKWFLVALPSTITGILGIAGALIVPTLLPRPNNGTAAPVSTNGSRPAVLDAPDLHFSAKPIDYSLPECMTKADAAMKGAGFSDPEKGNYIEWGYQKETTGLVWCQTDQKLVIFIGAGRDYQRASDLAEALRRSFGAN